MPSQGGILPCGRDKIKGCSGSQVEGKLEEETLMGYIISRGLTNRQEKKRSEKQRRKGKIFPFECRVPKTSKER